jgi:DNA-binding response OmpR family regulator
MMTTTILLIEDHSDVAEVLDLVLRYAGYEVIIATDGASGLMVARSGVPDLIILDLILPDLNGMLLIEQLKLGAATAAIPVLILTAASDQSTQQSALEAGCDAFIAKPFDIDHLLQQVRLLVPPSERCV